MRALLGRQIGQGLGRRRHRSGPRSARLHRIRSARGRILSVLVLAGFVLGLTSSPASAADWGGSGPSVAQCSYGATVYTVGAPVYLYYPSGEVAGYVEVRWSNWCPSSNWARLTSYVSARHAVSIHENARPANAAGADDSGVTVNWTPAILLASPSNTVCAYADIYSFKGHAAGVVCR